MLMQYIHSLLIEQNLPLDVVSLTPCVKVYDAGNTNGLSLLHPSPCSIPPTSTSAATLSFPSPTVTQSLSQPAREHIQCSWRPQERKKVHESDVADTAAS